MPKLTHSVPKYCRHKKTNQAYVTICGKMIYLGVYGTPESKAEYDRIIREWLSNGRSPAASQIPGTITIVELMDRFLDHAETYYRKDGRSTGSKERFERSFKPLFELYARKPVTEFGPVALKSVRDIWVKKGLARITINNRVQCIKQVFSWGTENELVPVEISQALRMVRGLQAGRTIARETSGVRAVDLDTVQKTLPYCSKMIQDMIQVQLWTGMRPNELVRMKVSGLDRSADIWVYTPEFHKTQHHGKTRRIAIGPRAQMIVFMNLAFHVGKIGPWESFTEHEVYLAPSWLLCFGIREEDITVAEEYYDLIDDPAERLRVQEGREKLLRQPVGSLWQDEFTICGQRVRSSAMVTHEKTLVGVDVLMERHYCSKKQ